MVRSPTRTGDTAPMGYNPHRPFKARTSDYVLVAVALAAATALVIWGIWG